MFQVVLIRPGMTEYDQQGRIQGTLDIPLCEDGRRQVAEMIDQLRSQPIAAIYTSPNQCAEQTAEAIGEALDVKVKTIDKFENLDHGLWQGMLVADVKAKQPRVYRQWQEQPETVCPPQGETISAAEERLSTSFAKIMKKHKSEGMVAVVVPEPIASVLRHVIRQDQYGDLWSCRNGSPLWEVLDVATAGVGAK